MLVLPFACGFSLIALCPNFDCANDSPLNKILQTMTARKKKFKIAATSEGVEMAEKALIRLGFDSKSNFAQSQLLARSSVTKFFQSESLQPDTFKKICQELKLDWRDISGILEKEISQQRRQEDCSRSQLKEESKSMRTQSRQVTVIDKDSKEVKVEIVLKGNINSTPNFRVLQSILREHSGNTVEILDINEGSIKLTVGGSQEDIDKLLAALNSGELEEVGNFPVEYVRVLSEPLEDDNNDEIIRKWCLVQAIVSQSFNTQDLNGADLSDADLSDTNLTGANLRKAYLSDADLTGSNLAGTNLTGADLTGTNLRKSNLGKADMIGANLSDADLSDANLTEANLRKAYLSDANLTEANLRKAYLMGANLGKANLTGADLSEANLTGADLSEANLTGANLIGANLIGANLSDTDLTGANLSEANLMGIILMTNLVAQVLVTFVLGLDLSKAYPMGANVKRARFGLNPGLSESMKQDLIQRGAIFEDSPDDDHSKVRV